MEVVKGSESEFVMPETTRRNYRSKGSRSNKYNLDVMEVGDVRFVPYEHGTETTEEEKEKIKKNLFAARASYIRQGGEKSRKYLVVHDTVRIEDDVLGTVYRRTV